ncbi:MAG TPA: sigma-70 family RNA polymerase sigma factor [Acidimicrobiales bacterium]|nr:sigma-70 family RNA polymerase sigma factor [Acidimicrobiales bacterium]
MARELDPVTTDALAAGRGDGAALERFIRGTQADVWRLCAHLGSRDEADDLTQETYMRAWRALPQFRADASARTWLLCIARRAAADRIRANRRRPVAVHDHSAAEPTQVAEQGTVEVRMLMEGLDSDRRLAMYLTQELGLSYAEAAEVCGCPIGTIRSRVARAREELIARLRLADAQ